MLILIKKEGQGFKFFFLKSCKNQVSDEIQELSKGDAKDKDNHQKDEEEIESKLKGMTENSAKKDNKKGKGQDN